MADEGSQGEPAGPEPGPDPDQRAAIRRAVAVSRWREAESKVYPLALVDPAMYEAAVTAVGLMASRIRAEHARRDELFALDVDILAIELSGDEAISAAVRAAHISMQTLVEAALAQSLVLLPG